MLAQLQRALQSDTIQIDTERVVSAESINTENKLVFDTRAQAISNIKSALAYYQKHEPHSPNSFLLERALRWSTTNLLDILDELVQQQDAKYDLQRILGVSLTVDEREQDDE